ncbi:phenylalanine--tRNA ligase subunit beta [Desulfopila aestuarii]|uniref:Phenylalanine--tRNA ligase beta subunit n=1 Tax=Desulfopila aestuarii DSM 18488 TaxID=1121416 RepID=A0A1M7YKN9_9BACT|nr:phenylalanine--tRNA ligase subunit beta [Desulfopila aestuarii]SHO53152.1 phenylalanyl-tRNA synthetase beta subunit [Desulfopila aestuarii DSM 18488]
MKLTRNWLQNYVDIEGISTSELADHLTMLGLEVDSVENLYQDLSDLKTGHIVTAKPHPDADKLQVCEVQIGEELHQIVCGAPNARAGLNVVVALPGITLPGNFKIKKSKVRGIESAGMICSERELGLSEDHTGIMELPDDVQHGQSFIEVMGLADTMIEVDLTPNRPDCASVIGIAREIAGITGRELMVPVKDREVANTSKKFQIDIESPELCPRYAARLIEGVKIGPSPWWLRRQLKAIGLRPINNVVDVTNYVMMEYGQPLHAFDFDTLAGGKIVVRVPRAGEDTFITLDAVDRKIDNETLLICDGEKPVALAGVMGGMNSEVTPQTVNVLLESACFNSVSIRRTARKVNLATDASYRFERGVDPGGTINAMDRAVQLLVEIAGGTAEDAGADCFGGRRPMNSLELKISRTAQLIGIELGYDRIAELLQSIGFICKPKDEDTMWVLCPTFRVDIDREADLVEEVARLYGYNNIPTTLPGADLSYPEQDTRRFKRADATRMLLAIGFSEAINYSFASAKHVDMLRLDADDTRRQFVHLLNPLSEDQAVMRTMLLPGLLENVKRNISFQKTAVKLFEVGKVFRPLEENSQPLETSHLAGVLCGSRHGEASPLYFKAEGVDILDAKGAVEYLLEEMRLTENSTAPIKFVHPVEEGVEKFCDSDYSLLVFAGDTLLGMIGKVLPDVLRSFGIKHDVYYFELNFDNICELQAAPRSFSSLPVYPSVKRDIALVVPVTVSAGELLAKVHESREKLIESAEIFDVFQGGKIEKGYKSVAVSITYRSATKTLTEKNVEKAHTKVVKLLTDTFGGSLRDA